MAPTAAAAPAAAAAAAQTRMVPGNTNFVLARALAMRRMEEDFVDGGPSLSAILEVCEEKQNTDYASMIKDTKVWGQRQLLARLEHLALLEKHKVYDREVPPAGTRLMTHRWVDRDTFDTAKSRFTCRGFEQALDGTEEFFAPTPRECVLRLLLTMAELRGLVVAVGDAAQAFLQAPFREENPVYVKPAAEANEKPGVAWKLRKTLPGLKGGPAAWGDYATEILLTKYGFKTSRH
jgi:hypothetical protein